MHPMSSGLQLYLKETPTKVFSVNIAKNLRTAFFMEHLSLLIATSLFNSIPYVNWALHCKVLLKLYYEYLYVGQTSEYEKATKTYKHSQSDALLRKGCTCTEFFLFCVFLYFFLSGFFFTDTDHSQDSRGR